jgi:predicted nucleic acid-binding protein
MSAAAEAFVLDASVTATWLLPDEQSEASDRLYGKLRASLVDAHAPELWLWECGNIIANGVKHRRIAPDDGVLVWSVLDAIRTRVELALLEPPQARACLLLGFEHGLSMHDAAYLWLAMSLKLPLLTHDERLAAAARGRKVEVLTVESFT